MSGARRDLCGGRPEPHWPSGLTGEGPFLPRPDSGVLRALPGLLGDRREPFEPAACRLEVCRHLD